MFDKGSRKIGGKKYGGANMKNPFLCFRIHFNT
jgi:hypothetical protein